MRPRRFPSRPQEPQFSVTSNVSAAPGGRPVLAPLSLQPTVPFYIIQDHTDSDGMPGVYICDLVCYKSYFILF